VVEIDGDRRVTTGGSPPSHIFRNDLAIDPCIWFTTKEVASLRREEPQISPVTSLQGSTAGLGKMGGGPAIVKGVGARPIGRGPKLPILLGPISKR
jgi:hypothetical protein